MTDPWYGTTTDVWDAETDEETAIDDDASIYHEVLDEVFEQLSATSEPTNILVPAIGTGRVVKDFLEREELPTITLHAVEPDKDKLEPDEEDPKKLKEHLETTGWEKRDVPGPDRYERSGSSIIIYNEHIETFLKEDRGAESYDAIFCFLFFHYIPHCFISVLRDLYKKLNEDGLFVVDELQGSDDDSRELLRCIDLHMNEFSALSDYNEDCRAWKNFYLQRLHKEAAFWGSAVKATQADIITDTLELLFDHSTFADSCSSEFSLTKSHLPWMWGHRRGKSDFSDWDEELREVFTDLKRDLNAHFRVYLFKGKKDLASTSKYWETAKQKSQLRANQGLDSILWSFEKEKDVSHTEVENMAHHVIPAVIMQLIASSGIFDYRTRITSAFLATGSPPWAPQGTTLEGLHILSNPTGKTKKDIENNANTHSKYWSINYHVFANLIGKSLSSDFINSREKYALGIKDNIDKDTLKGRGFNTLPIPEVKVDIFDGVDVSSIDTQKLISLYLLSIDRSGQSSIRINQENKEAVEEWVHNLPDKIEENDESGLSGNVKNLRIKLRKLRNQHDFRREVADLLPVNLLNQKLGTVLFLPIPGYFEKHDDEYSVGSIFGLGLTIQDVDEETLDEVEDLVDLSESLIQSFHDKYLSLKWIDDVRKAALRSAIGSIMLRNFAHNIGSHVAINASSQNIKSRIRKLYGVNLSSRSISRFISNGQEKEIQRYLEVVQWMDYVSEQLNEYQIHRNEYLSDFTNQSPVPTKFYRDLVLNFAENTLLMDNIAKSEGICFEDGGSSVQNRLKIRTYINREEVQCRYPSALEIGDGNCDDVRYPDSFPYLIKGEDEDTVDAALNDKQIEWESQKAEDDESDPDVEVILPNPHAFYSILENFIRNSAKHNENTLRGSNGHKNNLEVYVSVLEEGSSYCITIHDNVSVVDLRNEDDDAESAKGFQDAVEDSLLDERSNPRQENSGIADMKVNAFLLSTPAEALSDDTLKKKIDVVVCSKDSDSPALREFRTLRGRDEEGYEELIGEVGESGYFGYQFRLPKPKKICWLGSADDLITDKENLDQLTAKGITFYESAQDYLSESREQSLASFDFAVLREGAVRNWLKKTTEGNSKAARLDELLLALPCRALMVGVDEEEGVDEEKRPPVLQQAKDQRRVHVVGKNRLFDLDGDGDTADRLLRKCWHLWLERWDVNDDKKAQAYIYTDNVEGWAGQCEDVSLKHEETMGAVDLTVTSYDDDEKKPKLDPPEEGRLVTYERHGGLYNVFDSEKYREEIAPRLQKKEAANTFNKNSADFAQINYPPKNSIQRELLTYRLVEAGLLRVLVVDERWAGLSEENKHTSLDYVFRTAEDDIMDAKIPKGKDYRFWHQAAAANVYLATHVDISEGEGLSMGQSAKRLSLTLNEDNGASVSYQDEEIEGEQHSEFDVVVVHRTLFIKMRDQLRRENEDKNKSSRRLVRQLQQCAPSVVINSGGGEPHGIDRSIPYRFISYSKMSKCLSSNVSGTVIAKAKLANYLLTLRKNEAFG